MRIHVLCDNSALPGFRAEHGLSLLIEACGKRVLFDTGQSGLFLDNASRMGIDPSVDLCIISHGHYDHAGGLDAFLDSCDAPVFAGEGFFGCRLSMTDSGPVEIGVSVRDPGAVRCVGDRFSPADGFLMFSSLCTDHSMPSSNVRLMEVIDGTPCPDVFRHERNLLVHENGRVFLFTGCAHRGIRNIVADARGIIGRDPDAVIGGFHLSDPRGDGCDASEAEALCGMVPHAVFIAGHCTGGRALEVMKRVSPERVRRLSAGASFEL